MVQLLEPTLLLLCVGTCIGWNDGWSVCGGAAAEKYVAAACAAGVVDNPATASALLELVGPGKRYLQRWAGGKVRFFLCTCR